MGGGKAPWLAAAALLLAMPLLVLGTVLAALLVAGPAGGGCGGDGGPGGGSTQVGPRSWAAEQMTNARTIVDVATRLRLPRRAAVIAVATAIVESQLYNVAHGDRDSLGLFQQRPSAGWGTPAQILNPASSSAAFYQRLVDISGWAQLPLGTAAQAVQRSAFPDRYAPQEAVAADLVARFWVGPDNPIPTPDTGARGDVELAVAVLGCPDQGGSELPAEAVPLPDGFTLPTDPTQRRVVTFALAQVGKPYLWGGKGPAGWDCSGLTAAAWGAAGVAVSAGTTNQIHDGAPVAGLDGLQPGDLLFTPGSLGTTATPRHVGLYIGQGLVVDAHSTRAGVILSRLDRWTGTVVAVRRPGPTPAPSPVAALAAAPDPAGAPA